MKPLRRVVLLALAGHLLHAGAAEFAGAAVDYREVDLSYSTEGVVEAVRQSTVSAQISGRIVELRFDVGDYVKKSEVTAAYVPACGSMSSGPEAHLR